MKNTRSSSKKSNKSVSIIKIIKKKSLLRKRIVKKPILIPKKRRNYKDFFDRKRVAIGLFQNNCQICFKSLYNDRNGLITDISIQCASCKASFHKECLLLSTSIADFLCNLCKISSSSTKVLCSICKSSKQRSKALYKSIEGIWAHFICLITSPRFIIDSWNFPFKFHLKPNIEDIEEKPLIKTFNEVKIPCGLCGKKALLLDLIKCQDCHSFAHILCAFREKTWRIRFNFIPEPGVLKSLIIQAKIGFWIEFKALYPRLSPLIKGLQEDWLDKALNEIKASLFRGDSYEEDVKKSQKVLLFCPKHQDKVFGCCSRRNIGKNDYFCSFCETFYHEKCLFTKEIDIDKGWLCIECEQWSLKDFPFEYKEKLNFSLFIPSERHNLPLKEVLKLMSFFSLQSRAPLMDFPKIRTLLLGASALIFDPTGVLYIVLLNYLQGLLFKDSALFSTKDSLLLKGLTSIRTTGYEPLEVFQENKAFLEEIQKALSFISLSLELGQIKALLACQEVLIGMKLGKKVLLLEIKGLDFKETGGLGFPEVKEVEQIIGLYRRELIEIEGIFAHKEGILKEKKEELEVLLNTLYHDGISLKDYEDFLRSSLSLYKDFIRNLWGYEEIEGLVSRLESLPFDLNKDPLTIRLKTLLLTTKALEKDLIKESNYNMTLENKRGKTFNITLFKQVFLESKFNVLYDASFEPLIDKYTKYKLFCKRLEIFLILDHQIDLNSFLLAPRNQLYDSLHDYLLDLIDLSELPIIKDRDSSYRIYEVLNLENLDILTEEAFIFGLEIAERLKEKSQEGHNLQEVLKEILDKKPKEIGTKYTILDLTILFQRNNLFLPIFEAFYLLKLEKQSQQRTLISRVLLSKPLANQRLEELQRHESLLIENYEREASQELFEILALSRLTDPLLKKLLFHYDLFKKLGIKAHKRKEYSILETFDRLNEFLSRLFLLVPNIKGIISPLELFLGLNLQDFERLFDKDSSPKELLPLIEDFKVFESSKLWEKLFLFRACCWLNGVESLLSQTKGLSLLELLEVKESLERLKRDFPNNFSLIEGHYVYKQYEDFSKVFEIWKSLYSKTIAEPLAFKEKVPEESLENLKIKLNWLREEYKSLNLQFELGRKRIDDFEILLKGANFCQKTLEAAKNKGEGNILDLNTLKVLNEFEKACPLTQIFPFYGGVRDQHHYYQNISQELIEIKKGFNEKKLKFSKLVVLQLLSRGKNVVLTENVGFCGDLYQHYEDKVKKVEEIEQVLSMLKTMRFSIKNYKDLLRQSFQMTQVFSATIKKLSEEKTLKDCDFLKALELLSLIVTIRNDLVRKPLFFCPEVMEFAAYEWSFSAKSLLEGWVTYCPEEGLMALLQKASNTVKMPSLNNDFIDNKEDLLENHENLIEKPSFLINPAPLWEKVLSQGLQLQAKFSPFKSFDPSLIPLLQSRLSKLQTLRSEVLRIKALKAFLLENTESFFEQVLSQGLSSSISKDFKAKRKALLDKAPLIPGLLAEVLETRVFVREELEFLLDLEKTREELEKGLKILRLNLKKSLEKKIWRSLPQDLILNVFKTLYSSPFGSEFEGILEQLVQMISFLERKSLWLESLDNNLSETGVLSFLEEYEKIPICFDKLEALLHEYQEFRFLKTVLFEEMKRNQDNEVDLEDDIVEIEEDKELPYNWKELDIIEEQMNKRHFFKELNGFELIEMELWSRRIRLLEQISYNRKPSVFFTLTRQELKAFIQKGTLLLSHCETLYLQIDPFLFPIDSPSFLFSLRKELYKGNLRFLTRYIRKLEDELIRMGKLVLSDVSHKDKLKENALLYGKCIDLSKEILLITGLPEVELNSFVRRLESGIEEVITPIKKPEFLEKKPDPLKPQNTKTFQSIFKKEGGPNAPKPKGRPKKDHLNEANNNKEMFNVINKEINKESSFLTTKEGDFNQEIEVEEGLLEVFKTRKEKKEVVEKTEKERNRSVSLLTGLLIENHYIENQEFNHKQIASRLETQIYKKTFEIGEKYRGTMIKLMDILENLKTSPELTQTLLKDEQNIRLEAFLEVSSKDFNRKRKRAIIEETKVEITEESIEEENKEKEEDNLKGIMDRIQGFYNNKPEVFLIVDDK